MPQFTKIENKHLIISILILTFVFAFNDKSSSFYLPFWLLNFIKILIIITFSLLFKEIIKKYWAEKYGAVSEYRIWNIQRYYLRTKSKFPFPSQAKFSIFQILSASSNPKYHLVQYGLQIYP